MSEHGLRCEISAVSYEGLRVRTANGEPATLAVLDKDGNVIEAGPDVLQKAFNVAIESYRNFLKGAGHLRALSTPPANIRQQ
ncbi:hypothetical protein ACYT85_14965 [Ralstonia solanacearum]|uniref:hypothetical protein n=1 Tax=Ralstonia solanacearum TaxID=305 RepID=UPI0009BB335E|nr:hypothetical protein [Ralstonia solanacearum]MBB6591169.1 hypothetical protein [Ralstonia solanacearum]MBB6595363.1 hypothetical protein [Ralstonia solanacearum]MDB0541375.1 hypothetical protein [Ralstonia solanacearum]MDB0550711.1 hypothetical protein [Ralstonia solanacearum]MDB0556324.1 hypothetical protein [Ralstonia solanacearum]